MLRPLLCGKVPETDAMPQSAVPALLGKRLLALAAEPSTRDSNRSFIYALQQEAEVAATALGDPASGCEPKKMASAEVKSSSKAQPKSSAKVMSALKGMLDKGVQKETKVVQMKTKVSEVTVPPPPPPPPPARGRKVEKVNSKKSKMPKVSAAPQGVREVLKRSRRTSTSPAMTRSRVSKTAKAGTVKLG